MSSALSSLDLKSLRLLLTVVEEGNLGRAAARENIAVSAVSRRIQNLEARLGVTLLLRHDRGVEPTPAAMMVINRVRDMLALLDQIADDLSDVRQGSRGLIRIQAHATATSGVLPDLLARFLVDNPQVDVSLDEANSIDIINAVRHGTCDIGLVSGTVEAAELELVPWTDDELVAALSPGHPLVNRASIKLVDLLNDPFIAMHRDSALLALYRGQARGLGMQLIERAHVTSFDAAAKLVARGLGQTILPAGPARTAAELYGVILRPLDEPWAKRPLAICIRNHKLSTLATRSLINFLLESAG